MNPNFSMHRRALLRAGLGLAAAAATQNVFAAAQRKGFFAAHDLPIGLQMHTLGDAKDKDLEGTLMRVAKIGYRSIEMGLPVGGGAQARAAADKAGLQIGSVHVGADAAAAKGRLTVHDDAGRLAAELGTVGCRDLVLSFPLTPVVTPAAGEDRLAAVRRALHTSLDHWKRTAALLNERGAALQREGLQLSYHNHDMEFVRVGETSGWDVLLAETDPKLVSFQVDVAWVVNGGLDPVTFLEGLAGRVRALHVKDLRASPGPRTLLKMDSTEVGSGIVDWTKVLPAAYRAGARQFYVEQEPPFQMDRFDAAAKSYAYLSSV